VIGAMAIQPANSSNQIHGKRSSQISIAGHTGELAVTFSLGCQPGGGWQLDVPVLLLCGSHYKQSG